MTIQADFSVGYPPVQAENGKFIYLDPTTLTNYPSTFTNSDGLTGIPSTGRYAILTYQVNPATISLSGASISVSDVTISNILTSINVLPTATAIVSSLTLTSNTSANLTFTPKITLLEIYNNSTGKIYFDYNPSVTFSDLTNKGMIIDGESFYSIEKNITNIVIGSISGADVRVFGHQI